MLGEVWSEWACKECKVVKGRFHIGASERRCKQVHNYKYTSPSLSIAEEVALNEFWNNFAELYPMWLAPNLITFIGLLAQLSAFSLLYAYSPNLEGEAPWWVYLWAAFALFVYQTMDGTDGKQAKRTRSGSGLGELFDHGCDALATTVYAQYILDIMGWGEGDPLWSAITVVSSYGAFMTSNAVLVYEGVLPIQRFDCQELQLTIIGFCLLTACFGIGWRDALLPLPFTMVPGVAALPLPQEVSASKLVYGVGWLVSLQSQALFVSRALRSNKDRLFRCTPGVTLMAMGLHMVLTAGAWLLSPWKAATMSLMMVAFGDLMLRTIYMRIGDPEATSYSPAAWGCLAASIVNPYWSVEALLAGLMLVMYGYRVATVISQLTGCLGIPGVFRIRH